MNKLLFGILILIFVGCSSKPLPKERAIDKKVSSTNIEKEILNSVDDIPKSLLDLSKILRRESSEYMVQADKAIQDTLNSAKEAELGQDTARALKILSIGLRLMPWRNDLLNHRERVLQKYTSLIETSLSPKDPPCSQIREKISDKYVLWNKKNKLSSNNEEITVDLPSHTVNENKRLWNSYDWTQKGEEWTEEVKKYKGIDPIQP